MKHHLRVYRTLLSLNFATLTAYRSNFINSIVSSVAWGVFSFVSIVLLTARTPLIFGWKREEIILLTVFYNIVIGIFHMVLSKNFERFSRMVEFGQLDTVLTKPVDSQFLLSLWLVNYASIFRILLGIVFAAYLIVQTQLILGVTQVFLFLLFLGCGLVLLYSLWYVVVIITIWLPRLSNLVFMMYTISGMARFPREMYHQLHSYMFFFLIPITLIVAVPTKTLLGTLSFADAGIMLAVTAGFFLLSRIFWRFALRFYTSASS